VITLSCLASKLGNDKKGNAMSSPAQALVHYLVATQLQIDRAWIEDVQSFDELGLDQLDLVLVVIRLEDLNPGEGEFPLKELADATTVGDLVALVDVWLERDVSSSIEDTDPQRRSVA
jgi:acyl carrier protein